MHIQLISLLRCHSPRVRSHTAATCSVNSFTVHFHPLSYLCQSLHGNSRQFAIGLRTYIHQEIGILTGCFHQIVNQSFCRLIVLVCNLISPHAIHCLARFQWQVTDTLSGKSRLILTGQITLKNLYIFSLERCPVMIITNQTGRLQAVYQRILSGQLPIETGIPVLIPPAVEPYCAYFPVTGQQLRQLVIHKSVIAVPVSRRIRTSGSTPRTPLRSILAIPVYM